MSEFILSGKRVYVAGHSGMVGSALCRRLSRENCDILQVSHADLDLRRQTDTQAWFDRHRPQAVFLAAARVGGILENRDCPAEFIYDNLAIALNVLEAARRTGVEKLLFLGSSCIYPKHASQPIAEGALLSGPLEPTNSAYAVAKIAGIKMAQSYREQYGSRFIAAQPTNLYGPGDNFDLRSGHVLPALLRKAHEAKLAGASAIEVWGSGKPLREFMYVDNCAEALVFLMKSYDSADIINVGTGEDIRIDSLTRLICEAVGFDGELRFDPSLPDGTPRKLLDVGRLHALGWTHSTTLRSGLDMTYRWYLDHIRSVRGLDHG